MHSGYFPTDNEKNDQLSPDFKKTHDKHPPAASQENGKEKKWKRKQNAISNKRKKPKFIQSSLITDMFNRMAQSQTKDRQDDHDKRMENLEDITKEQVRAPSQPCIKNSAAKGNMMPMRDDYVDLAKTSDIGDDDVICLMDDNIDVFKSTPGIEDGSQKDRQKQSMRTIEPSKSNRIDQTPTRRIQDERQDSSKEELFFPMPTENFLLVDILKPPQMSNNDDKEIEEPGSPSEVLEFCNKWVAGNLKKMSKVTHKVLVPSHSRDIFEPTVAEIVSSVKNPSANKHTTDNANKFLDDDDDYEQQQETSVSLFSVGEVSPVIGKFHCTSSKVIRDTDDNENKIFGTPKGARDSTELSNIDISPVVGRSSTLHCSSTPKVVSRSLFKKFTPGLSTVEEFSPIPRREDTSSSSSNLCHPFSTLETNMRKNKCQKETARLSDTQLSHRRRIKSKLSRFARPEVPELGSVAEISPVDKAKISSSMLLVKGSGKKFQKKLHYDAEDGEEEIPFVPNKPEIHRSKLNGEFDKVKDFGSLHNKATECKNTSSFLFEDLNKINSSRNSGGQIPDKKIQQNMNSVSYSNISDSASDSPRLSWKPKEENKVKGEINVTNALHKERSQQSVFKVFKGGEVESSMDSKKINEAAVNSSPDIMEDFSLFERIEECEVEPTRSSAAEKREELSTGLSVTQVLHFMDDTQHIFTTSKFPQSSQIHSQNLQKNKTPPAGHLPAKRSLSLSRNSHRGSEYNKSDQCTEEPSTSTTTLARDRSKLCLSKTQPKIPARSNQIVELKKTQDYLKEKHVSFCKQENEEFDEMSESLLADIDFALVKIPHNADDMQSKSVSKNKNSSILYPLPAKDEDQVNKTHEGSKNLSCTGHFSSKEDDKEKSKLMSPTQGETQLLVTRKRKVCNVIGSDQEDSLINSGSEKDISKTSTTSENSRNSTVNMCVTASLRKSVADQLKNQFEDDDGDFVEVLGPPQPKQQKAKNVVRKKRKVCTLTEKCIFLIVVHF